MEDWLRESFVSPIFEDSYSTDCHVCNTSTNITGTQTPCPAHNFDIGWCPDGCEPAPDPDALPDFNNFPCEHHVGVRDGETVMDSIVVAAYKFDLVEDKAVCADFQVSLLLVLLSSSCLVWKVLPRLQHCDRSVHNNALTS